MNHTCSGGADCSGELNGAVVLVTGGLGRLGLALVDAIESRGGTAVATTRDPARAEAFDSEALRQGRRARAVVFSMDAVADVLTLLEMVLSRFGRVTALVNNAYAACAYAPPGTATWAHWADATRVGLAIPEALSGELVRRSTQTGITAIVNVASMYGLVAPDPALYSDDSRRNPSVYGPIKAALVQMTRYHAVHWAQAGVRVNAVSPGGIFDDQEGAFLDRYNRGVPLGRMVTREEVAAVICFLISPQSSGMIGQNVVIDGGRTII